MVRAAACLLLAACSGIDVGVGPQALPDAGAVAPDAPASVDAAFGCDVVVPRIGGEGGASVGGTGGSKGPVLACNDFIGERIVGVSVQMSNQNTSFGARSAQGIRLACAAVTIGPDGSAQLGPVTARDASGTGDYGWSPSTWTAITSCKPGWVVSGVLAHTGTTSNLFVDVSITCSKLDSHAAVVSTEKLKVVGSLVNTAGPEEVVCPQGDVVSQVGTYTGAGLDAVTPYCSKPACR